MKIKNINEYLVRDYAESYATVVAPLFRLYGWTYGKNIPSNNELADTVEDLMIEAIEDKRDFVTFKTGRFVVEKGKVEGDTELNVFLELGTIYDINLFNEEK